MIIRMAEISGSVLDDFKFIWGASWGHNRSVFFCGTLGPPKRLPEIPKVSCWLTVNILAHFGIGIILVHCTLYMLGGNVGPLWGHLGAKLEPKSILRHLVAPWLPQGLPETPRAQGYRVQLWMIWGSFWGRSDMNIDPTSMPKMR